VDYLTKNLHKYIINSKNFPHNPKLSIRQAFRRCEFEIKKLLRKKEKGKYDKSGSCAIIALVIDKICYVVNLGNSRALLSADSGKSIVPLSKDHKPD